MADFLFELGCEELPAGAVARASADLEALVIGFLKEEGLGFGEVKSWCTPRRLILSVKGLPEKQEDSTEESRGPSEQAAFGEDGTPSRALQGFCRGKGVDPSAVEIRDGYVWVTQTVLGKGTNEVLAEILPKSIRSLNFDKTMRWGGGRMRFARPIRWILAVLGGETVGFEVEGVVSANRSRGHRFDAPEEFVVTGVDQLLSELRSRHVEPDSGARRERLLEQAKAVASGAPDLPEGLVDENVFLTEWPTAHEGTFDEAFLDLPEPVLVTAMAKHQRFFPVRGDDGAVLNRFVAIRNSGLEENVKAGNEWVLNARFNDAQFFFEEDKDKSMDDLLGMTDRMLFQDKLGTVRQRADRLSALAGFLAKEAGLDEASVAAAQQAGLYAKADLACGLVSELSSLQGVIGGEYAKREGMPEEVAVAISAQYNTSAAEGHPVAVALLQADQIDKLVGFVGTGLLPKGSSDPFGLRRCATVLIDSDWESPGPANFQAAIAQAELLYREQGVELESTEAAIADIFRGRYEALMSDLAHDVYEASVSGAPTEQIFEPKTIRVRAQAVAVLDKDVEFIQTMRRPLNILSAAMKKGDLDLPEVVSPEKLDSASGVALLEEVTKVQTEVHHLLLHEEPAQVAGQLQHLAGFIHDFFENTMVMADDDEVRGHRLKLVAETAKTVTSVGDFTRIVLEGEKKS